MNNKAHRDRIFVESAEVLSHKSFAAQQYILRIEAPKCAATAQPGSFMHIKCHPQLAMRRPLSIMRASPQQGWVDLLYKVEGNGTQLLSRAEVGDRIDTMGPIGTPFTPHLQRPRPLLMGGGVGIPPIIFLAEALHEMGNNYQPLVLMGSEIPFPFQPRPSEMLVSGIPDDSIAAMPLLDDWGIASRLASQQGYPGCYLGYVTELADAWLKHLDDSVLQQVEIFACGPHPMLAAVAQLARHYQIPCQVSLEEYMACAVGGCAGCTVKIHTPSGPAMKRVCVDGPVFDALQVFPS